MRQVYDVFFSIRFFIITFMIGGAFIAGLAQNNYQPVRVNPLLESWRWKSFPELEGKGIRSIAEDRSGRIWFGLDKGVMEYNGYDWKPHTDENGLLGEYVDHILVSGNKKIYASTSQGIFVFNGKKWETVFEPDSNLNFIYGQFRVLPDSSIMMCSNYGVIHFKQHANPDFYATSHRQSQLKPFIKDVRWIILPEIITQNGEVTNISDVLQDKNGQIWMAITVQEEGSLLKFHLDRVIDGKISEYELLLSNSQFQLGEDQQMIISQDHKIWVSNTSYKKGITVFDGKKPRYIRLSDKFGGDEYTTSIVQAQNGVIWVGSLGKLYTYQNDKWEVYDSRYLNIPANKIVLFPGQDMRMWIAGLKSKIYLLDYSIQRWQTYDGLNFQCESLEKEQWFLSVEGEVIKKVNEDEWKSYGTSDGIMDAPVRIICTSQEQIWVAGSHRGVAATAMLKDGSWKLKLHPQLSWGIDYRAVFEDQSGALWFGGSVDRDISQGQIGGVLQLLHPGTSKEMWIHHKYREKGLMQSNAYGIGQSKDGRIWLGGGSLLVYDGKTWEKASEEPLQEFVNIVHSREGVLWVGSRYYGVFRYDGKNWERYDTESGLSSNTIISIYAQSENCVWVATENGVCRFDGKEWTRNVFPSDMNMSFEGGNLISTSDGAIWLNKSLREWKRRGFTYSRTPQRAYQNFNTYRYFPDNNPPETRIDIYTPEVSQKGNTLISWKGEDFFRQTPTENLAYSFRFNDGDWSPFIYEPYHTFTDLPSGMHTFEVRARDIERNIDPTPARITFHVLPPVWQQTWFILLILVFIITIGIFEYKIISKKQQLERQNIKIQEQKDELEKMVVEIEELSRTKVNFFTNISHELRTPLSLILGPVAKLKDTKTLLPVEMQQKFYQLIEQNALRLLQLINQLLEIRRIESSTLHLNMVKQDIILFVEQIVEIFRGIATDRTIDLSFQASTRHAVVSFDPDKMEKVIVNLLSNAFKYTEQGGSISIFLQKVAQKTEGLDNTFSDYIKIEVKDTGMGIPTEMVEHIFDRFYTSNKKQKGYGIGLSYIKELVDLHHGKIYVKSTLGEGTCFTVFIPQRYTEAALDHSAVSVGPYAKAAVAETSQLTPRSSQLPSPIQKNVKKKHLLIVEDSEDMIQFLHAILCQNYHVQIARDGIEGIKIAQTEEIDIIISDVMMPRMDGLKFCEYLKTNILTSHIPVILLTAKNKDEHKVEGFDTGADAYICKPFNPGLLETRIENLLTQRKRLQKKFAQDFILNPKKVNLTSPDEKLMKKLLEMMEKHIDDSEFNVQKMCKEVHLSHMHFIRKVKQLTGKKPSDLFRSFRMKRAKSLLKQNKLNISEVAYMVGYDAPSSFSRAFKKEFGVSPKIFVEEQNVMRPSI